MFINTPPKELMDGHVILTSECTQSCDFTWTDHLTRRVDGVYAALSERAEDAELRAPSFYIESRHSLSLYELDCVPPSGSFSLRVVAWWSSVATVAPTARQRS